MSEKYWLLKRCDLFERLTADELHRVERRCRLREVSRGSPIYLPADQANGVLLVASGRVKICSFSPDGKQSILAFVEPGEIFGELSLFDSGDREEYTEAVEKSTLVLIPSGEVQRLIDEHPQFSMGVTKLIGLRRRRVERRLKYLLFHSNRDRLIHLLVELVEQYGCRVADGIDLGIKLSHQDLANIIGSTRETVTVLLGEMQSEGFLRVGRRKIVLTRLDDLAASVGIGAAKVGSARSKRVDPVDTARHGAVKHHS